MFLKNKYSTWYNAIITCARLEENCRTGYLEKHHICPRSLGGSDDPGNIVKLTVREHFICHRLLVKMVLGESKSKMWFAFWATSIMKRNPDNLPKINSRTYQILRQQHSENISKLKRGVPRSLETRTRISISKSGKRLSAEHCLAISEAIKKRPLPSDATRKKIGNAHRNKILSEETKLRIGASSKNRKANLYKWDLLDPSGSIHSIVGIKDFCQANNLPWKCISKSLVSKVPVLKGVAKGWMAISKSKN